MEPTSNRYLNRELSWLEYNQRFLDEADDGTIPLLERLHALTLAALHLDEFFMVRVGALQMLAQHDCRQTDLSGMSPVEQLRAIYQRTQRMAKDMYASLSSLEKGLARSGIRGCRPADLSERQVRTVEQVFENEIASVLAPLAVTSPDTFPVVENQTLIVGARLRNEQGSRFIIVPFGNTTHRFLTLYSEGGFAYLLLEDAVAMFLDQLFPTEEVLECLPFRLTQHAEADVRNDLAGDLLEHLPPEAQIDWRERCLRLEIDHRASEPFVNFLQAASHVPVESVYRVAGPIDLAALGQLYNLPGFEELKYDTWPPQPSPAVSLTTSMFDNLANRDILLHHPYDSFSPVVRLIEEAAADPDVVAIKQTLYGTDRDSPIVEALVRAAENDKYVTAIVELKPRFRDPHKREWTKSLEQSGVQVIFGIRGLRTHAKLCIIVRREPTGMQRYIHFGTGDYSETTARLFSDISLLTSDEELGADATSFFNSITSQVYSQRFRRIDAAPGGLRQKLIELIQMEVQRVQQGQAAGITAKLNALGDQHLIDALYTASQQGVTVRLMVCGLCCLVPGVKGLSDNIQVINIVDRFREHARIFHFQHGGDEQVYISSADWMPRNFDRRVELLVPIQDRAARRRLTSVLDMYFEDNVKSAELQGDGMWVRKARPTRKARIRSQESLYNKAIAAVRQAEQSRRTIFEPHRAPDANV